MGMVLTRTRIVFSIVIVLAILLATMPFANAQESAGAFSLQVTPSPLVFSAKPGTATTVPLKIRNAGPQSEELKIESKSFKLNQLTGDISLLSEPPREVDSWISFSSPVFTVKPGEWYTQNITFNPPASAGFSYSFALQISRTQDPTVKEGERGLKGTVAVFTLINIDRPDATKKLEIASFEANKNVYEYLPVTLATTLRNTGNTILQPYGNIFIQRNYDDQEPIATLPFNDQRGYILPDTTRTLTNTWDDGFPVFITSTNNGKESNQLSWNWGNIDNLRFGKYTAKLVAVYSDGSRDIPLEATTQFWVLPWKFILAGLAIFAIFVFGIWSILNRFIKTIRRKTSKKKPKNQNDDDNSTETKINVRIGK